MMAIFWLEDITGTVAVMPNVLQGGRNAGG